MSEAGPQPLLPHLGVAPASLPRYALICGDPQRVHTSAALLDEARIIAEAREFTTLAGRFGDVGLVIASHGIGASSTEICMVELAAAGVDTIIRVGTCGAMQADIEPGDLIITERAWTGGGVLDAYRQPGFPAEADPAIVAALAEAAKAAGTAFHTGLTVSTDSFYAGQGRALPEPLAGHLDTEDRALIEVVSRRGVKNLEMEGATVLGLAGVFGMRAGMVAVAGSNRITGRTGAASPLAAMKVALGAMARIAAADGKRAALSRT